MIVPTIPVERTVRITTPAGSGPTARGCGGSHGRSAEPSPGSRSTTFDRVTQVVVLLGGRRPAARREAGAHRSYQHPTPRAGRDADVDTLVSACPWSERPLTAAGAAASIDVVDLHELLAEALGIDVGGETGVQQ